MDQSPSSPVHKRPRLLEFWQLGKTKVCFAILCVKIVPPLNYGREYNLCVVDLCHPAGADPNYFPPISPTFRIDCGIDNFVAMDAFCVLGSKLFMFEGYSDKSKQSPTKDVYAIDISVPPRQRLLKSELPKVGEMLGLKCNPAAIPTPDGKNILVFPTHNAGGFVNEGCTVDGFELFDPVEGFPKQLPPIQIKLNHWLIEAYGFINDTTLLAQIHSICASGMYVLDLVSPDKEGWVYTAKILTGVERIPTNRFFPTSYFEIIEDRFCFAATYGAHDLEDPDKDDEESYVQFYVPETESVIEVNNELVVDYLATLLNHNEERGYCHFCELRLERSRLQEAQSSCRFEFEVGVINLDRYKQDQAQGVCKSKEEYVDPVTTVRFCLNFGGEYQVHTLPIFFSI